MSRTKFPNVTEVRRGAREDWEKQFRRQLTIQELIQESVPWWLVIVAAVFFGLSVPHTIAIFDKITPDVGKIAPLGLEFGLLYAAFQYRRGERSAFLLILEVLLFATSIIVNGAGSLKAVVESTEDIQGLSTAELIRQIGDLPATSQVALVLVPIAAIIIPIGTVVAGSGLAALALEFRAHGNLMAAQWEQEQQDVEFMALRDAAINMGHTPYRANKWAAQVVQLDMSGQVSGRRRSGQTPDKLRTGQPDSGLGATEAVLAYLSEHGQPSGGVRRLADLVSDEMGVPVGKTTAHGALNQWKASQNGHGQELTGE